MKACIFFISEAQSKNCDTIEAVLREHLFQDIRVERLGIPENYNEDSSAEAHEAGARYLELLKGCVCKRGGFRIVLRDESEGYCYLGKTDSADENFLDLYRLEMGRVFPAVAIMDRMVMLPLTISEAFSVHPPKFTWFPKPLYSGGVVLLDFSDEAWVREAVLQVAGHLKAEIGVLCRQHMAVRGIRQPDLAELGSVLDVDPGLLARLQNEILSQQANIRAQIVSGPAVLGRSSRVTMTLRNDLPTPLKHVRVQVHAPPGTLDSSLSQSLDVPACTEEPVTVSFRVTPGVPPYCPLEVHLHSMQESQCIALVPVSILLEVASPGSANKVETGAPLGF